MPWLLGLTCQLFDASAGPMNRGVEEIDLTRMQAGWRPQNAGKFSLAHQVTIWRLLIADWTVMENSLALAY